MTAQPDGATADKDHNAGFQLQSPLPQRTEQVVDEVLCLLLYGICAISLTSTGSHQEGIRVCISQMNRPEQFDMLDERLALFAQNHKD